MGNAYYKQDKLEEALKYYEKSLSEHRSADVLKKCQAVMLIYEFYIHVF